MFAKIGKKLSPDRHFPHVTQNSRARDRAPCSLFFVGYSQTQHRLVAEIRIRRACKLDLPAEIFDTHDVLLSVAARPLDENNTYQELIQLFLNIFYACSRFGQLSICLLKQVVITTSLQCTNKTDRLVCLKRKFLFNSSSKSSLVLNLLPKYLWELTCSVCVLPSGTPTSLFNHHRLRV